MNTSVENTGSDDIRNPITNRPFGRIRWLSVYAGLIAALAILAVMSVVGIATGAASYNPNGAAATVGIGAGLWGVVSAIVAFLTGGWLAARMSAVRRNGSGLLNGALVWVGALALILFILSSGLGTHTPANKPAVNSGTNITSGVPADPAIDSANPPTNAPTDGGQIAAQNNTNAAPVDNSLWNTLAWAVLGFIAASLGGWLGARSRPYDARTQDASVGFETNSRPGHD